MPLSVKKLEIGLLGSKIPDSYRKIRKRFVYVESTWLRSKNSNVGCLGQKCPINAAKLNGGGGGPKYFLLGRKIQKWRMMFETPHIGQKFEKKVFRSKTFDLGWNLKMGCLCRKFPFREEIRNLSA